MGVVGSLPSETISHPISSKQEAVSNEEESANNMSVSYKIISKEDSKMNTKIDSQPVTSTNKKCSGSKHYTVVSYGPINVRVNLEKSLTLKNGRRSKFIALEGDAAEKRERRRARNRESAHKLKEKRLRLEKQLCIEIDKLETRENDLEQEIKNLRSYKQFLERRIQELTAAREQIIGNNAMYFMHLETDAVYSPHLSEYKLHFDE